MKVPKLNTNIRKNQLILNALLALILITLRKTKNLTGETNC